jgi:co-chaperonin GroES (HSP10)
MTNKTISPLNTSGIKPWEYKVLVRPDEIPELSKGGIMYTSQIVDQMKRAMCKGTIVDMSRLAFNYDVDMTTVIPPEERPQIGMRVIFAKYAGGEIEGEDRITYRIMNDKDIMGQVVSEREEFEEPVVPLVFKGSAAE